MSSETPSAADEPSRPDAEGSDAARAADLDPPIRENEGTEADAPAHDATEAEPVGAERLDDLDQEPTLREHLAATWRDAPPRGRWVVVAAFVACLAWIAVPRLIAVAEGPSEEEIQARAALDRAQWAAMLQQSPADLTREPVQESLGPGDAERSDDRYADYYAHQADSTEFSILVTSDAFAPDLAVRLPDGRTVAASNLLRTTRRAEIDGLQGPGRFEIVVTSRDVGASGAYQLEVVPGGPIDSVYVDEDARLDTLGVGTRRSGRYERVFGVSTGSELPVVLRVVSTAFRPRLHLFGPNGEVRGAWQTLERSSSGDSLHGAVLRYLPGWDAPYRLIVSSENPGETGPFALDVQSIDIRDLPVDGRGLRSTLGDESWLENGRYVDTYKFRTRDGTKTILTLQSDEFAPALRVWRIERRSREEVTENLNTPGANALRYEAELDPGEYFLEVTSGGADSTYASGRTPGGSYSLVARAESIAPPPPPPSTGEGGSGPDTYDGPVPPSQVFSTEVRRTGESGGNQFEVGVTNVAISYPGGSRTRVQLSVTVRSIDYTGNWAPWSSFAGRSYVVDDRGRRFRTAVGESQSPSGSSAEPGTARRGTVVFYLNEVAPDLKRVVLVASIGERTVTLPISVP